MFLKNVEKKKLNCLLLMLLNEVKNIDSIFKVTFSYTSVTASYWLIIV